MAGVVDTRECQAGRSKGGDADGQFGRLVTASNSMVKLEDEGGEAETKD